MKHYGRTMPEKSKRKKKQPTKARLTQTHTHRTNTDTMPFLLAQPIQFETFTR